MLWKGNWKGRQIIPERYMNQALTPASYLKDPKTEKPLQVYGFQFWMQPYKELQTVSMRGLLGQLIWAIPSKNAVIVRLGHKEAPQKSGPYFKQDSEMYLEAALKVLK
jgi:CubicO group peptidase (beta-lactamase class C family)